MSQLPENEKEKDKGSPSNFGEPLLYLIVSFSEDNHPKRAGKGRRINPHPQSFSCG